ncbi:MAG: hypothetical protein PVJ15_02895 [Gammaproteobacteria bacterium]
MAGSLGFPPGKPRPASNALLADSLDMLADALIYALGLFALGNLGVLLAAIPVRWNQSPIPDIVIGLAIAMVVIRPAWHIVREVRNLLQAVAE